MSEIERVAQSADFIVNGYSFICEDGKVRVLIKQCLDNGADIETLACIKDFSESGNLIANSFLNEVSDADR